MDKAASAGTRLPTEEAGASVRCEGKMPDKEDQEKQEKQGEVGSGSWRVLNARIKNLELILYMQKVFLKFLSWRMNGEAVLWDH